MKSNYSTNRPLMKMSSSPEMMSSRPPHETSKPEAAGSTIVPVQKGQTKLSKK